MKSTARFVLFSIASLLALAPAAAASKGQPKLVVMIVVDALGSDLFEHAAGGASGGFSRLATQGNVHLNAYHRHGVTETCAGHATIMTGLPPRAHGITANDWYSVEKGRVVHCAEAGGGGVGPDQLLAPTIGDRLKAADPRSRVFVIAGKSYAAAMMGGRRADEVIWVDAAQAIADTSRRTPLQSRCGPMSSDTPPRDLSNLDRVVLDRAADLLSLHGLGRGPAPDLLAISLSATDVVGHLHGAGSPEMCAHLATLDVLLGSFFDRLDRSGVDALVVLTADHGQSDTPERLAEEGQPARRVSDTITSLNSALRQRLSLSYDPIRTATGEANPQGDAIQLYAVTADGTRPKREERDQILAAASNWLGQRDEVQAVFRDQQLDMQPALDGVPPESITMRDRMRLSYAADRSGDLMVVYKPYVTTLGPGPVIANHGSPHNYDRRVPIVFMGKPFAAKHETRSTSTEEIAPAIISALSSGADLRVGR